MYFLNFVFGVQQGFGGSCVQKDDDIWIDQFNLVCDEWFVDFCFLWGGCLVFWWMLGNGIGDIDCVMVQFYGCYYMIQ